MLFAAALVSATMMPFVETTARTVEVPAVLVEVKLQRAELQGGMASIRSAVPNAPYVVPRGSVGGPSIFVGPSVVFTTRMGYVQDLSAPKVLALSGQEAEVVIGEPVSYIELDDEGDVRLVELEGVYEGLRVRMTPVILEDGRIDFTEFEITLSEVIGRVDIADAENDDTVPIAGGRPVVRSVTYEMPLTIDKLEAPDDAFRFYTDQDRDDEEPAVPVGRADIVFATEDDADSVFWITVTAGITLHTEERAEPERTTRGGGGGGGGN